MISTEEVVVTRTGSKTINVDVRFRVSRSKLADGHDVALGILHVHELNPVVVILPEHS
jgi:hypothetical protein